MGMMRLDNENTSPQTQVSGFPAHCPQGWGKRNPRYLFDVLKEDSLISFSFPAVWWRSQCWKSTSCKVRMILWRYAKKASGIFIHFSNTSLTCTTQYRTKCPRKIWTRMNLETSTFVSTELLFAWVREVLPWNFILLQLSAEKNNGQISPWKTKSARWDPSRLMKQQGSQRDQSKRNKEESGRRFKQKPHLVLK